MLTNETKQRINTCRDILVGKLPDPKSQVIQITNALIYKFMDDQDRLAEKLGGKASFFIKELKPYAWHKLFDSKLTNQDRADLYVEGVQKLSEAKHLPELFQEIFKEAYVPFRAAQTITLFISEINKFDYNHSEELGNAYEYLLSIMGSQGDAGQFRTPRHIIEFMVDVVDPQKGETVYDPACGTAGFLISAYTHILQANNGKLSATERRKLGENISGIDISPDMAKMARVNLYLHGFSSPVINEGDTLSDEDLWGTKYDVILANPPFMSPKGGIIPHDKFGVKAKRAEVLFVDYIAEHLKLKGRAAIVVPEGVIFQSGTTYKALRKMLVEDGYLHSVISLPAGVFQPYSGVKTSILVLDREKAKEATEVLFLKIENDGYTLNTQRSEREGSQLPEALEIAKNWQNGVKRESSIASWVSKREIAESEDYNLTGERYRTFMTTSSQFDFVEVDDVIETITPPGKLAKTDYKISGLYPVIDQSLDEIAGYSDNNQFLVKSDKPLVIFGDHTCAIKITDKSFVQGADGIKIIKTKDELLPEFLYFVLKYKPLESDGYQRHFSKLKRYKIPLPPIEVQQEIVAELDRYQKIIDGARQVVENYKPSFKIDPEWKRVELNDICEKITDGTHSTPQYTLSGVPFLRVTDITNSNDSKKYISKEEHEDLIKRCYPQKGDVLYSKNGTIGVAKLVDWDWEFSIFVSLALLKPKRDVLSPRYLEAFLNSDLALSQAKSRMKSGTVTNLHLVDIKTIKIPLPSLEIQEEIVEVLNKERALVETSKEIIKAFEQKVQDKISEVWGE